MVMAEMTIGCFASHKRTFLRKSTPREKLQTITSSLDQQKEELDQISIFSTYIEELDGCVGVKATWTGFAFHWTPTPRNYNFNGDDDDVENDDDYSDVGNAMEAGYRSQISKSLIALEGRSFPQIPTCNKIC